MRRFRQTPDRPWPSAITAVTRRLGKVRGLERILNCLVPIEMFDPDEKKTVHIQGWTITIHPKSWIDWQLYCFGDYEPGLRSIIRKYVRPGDTCLDIGANIGWHALLLSRLVGSAGRVLAFEPNPNIQPALHANLSANAASNVDVYPLALGATSGIARFEAPVIADRYAGGGHLLVDGAAPPAASVPVEVRALDDVLPASRTISVVKIDVEGWEPAVWRGAAKMLQRDRPVICMEYSPKLLARAGFASHEATEPLERLGYTFMSYSDRAKPATIKELDGYTGDILALPQECIASRRS